MSRRHTTHHDGEDGQALVELALVLPIVLMLLIGAVELSRVYSYWNDQTSIANSGARYAAVGTIPSGYATLAAWIRDQAGSGELKTGNGTGNGVQGSGIDVCVSIPSPTVGSPVTVKVHSDYKFLPLPKPGGGTFQIATAAVNGSATSRLEAVPPSGIATTSGACP